MSWYLSHHLSNMHLPFMRLSAMHKGVSIGLLCSVGTAVILPAAQAATMGKTVITSVQHQPLTASITVTGIRSADFSASLASPVVYQQLGLTPMASMSVSFMPTSATTGTVVISSTQPITMPFTDVVLALNDQGQRQVVPKTLLMPLTTNVSTKQSNSILASVQHSDPSTLIVNAHTANPLIVKRGAPPILAKIKLSEPTITANTTVALPVNNTALLSASKTDSPQILVTSREAPPPLFTSHKPVEPVFNASQAVELAPKKNPSLAESQSSSNSPQILVASRQAPPPLFTSPKPVEPVFNASQAVELAPKKNPSLAEFQSSSPQILVASRQAPPPLFASPKPVEPVFNASQAVELAPKKNPSLAESQSSSPQILVASRQAPPPLFASPKPVEPVFNASQAVELAPKKNPSLAESQSSSSSPQILVASRQAPPPLFTSPKTQNSDMFAQSRIPHNTISISERRMSITSIIESSITTDHVISLTAVNNRANDNTDHTSELTSVSKIANEQKQQVSHATPYPSLNTQISRKIMKLNLNGVVTSETISTRDYTHKRLPSPLATQEKVMPSYVVQKNDNLWVISQQVAEQNNLDVLIVMNQIKSQNLDAFVNKNSNHLKADAKLDLSYYDTVPSQQRLQSAIADKRQQGLDSNKVV